MLDPVQESELRSAGYVIIDLFEPDRVDEVFTRARELTPADRFRPDGTALNQASYHCTFLDVSREYRASVSALIDEFFTAPLAADLPHHRLLAGNLYVKPPGTGRFELHQNWQTTADLNDITVTAWCPLMDVTSDNGTICVLPGSHKLVPAIEAVTTPKYYERFYDRVVEEWMVPISMRRGQCLIFDDTLLHWSDDNRSDADRWAVQIDLIPDTADPVVYWLNSEAEPKRFEAFHADRDFWTESDVTALREGPRHLPRRGFRPYVDLRLDEEEFLYLMSRGPALRERYFAGEMLEDLFAEAMAAR